MKIERLFLVVSLVACKGSGKEASPETKRKVAELAPVAAKKLEAIAALAPKAKEAAPVSTDEPLEKLPWRAKLAIVGEEWLADPSRRATSEELDLSDISLYLCKSAATSTSPVDDDVKHLEACVALEQVAVVRKRNVRMPEIDDANRSFEPGRFDGDVIVFDLASGEQVAGYTLSATNTDKLELSGEPTGGHWYREAIRDLTKNTTDAAEKLFAAKLPPPTP